MKKAFGILELLIVIIIAFVIYFTCFNTHYGRKNPFDDNSEINSKQEIIEDKIREIENSKATKRQIEKNLQEGN